VYVDKRELVTLMTLGAHPEWLVLGYLRNQRLVSSLDAIESVTVDWEVGAAAVKTRPASTASRAHGQARGHHRLRPGQRVRRPDGRGGSRSCCLPARMTQAQLYGIVNAIRRRRAPTSPPARCTAARCSAARRCCCSSRTSAATTPSTPSPAGCGCATARHAARASGPDAPLVFYTTGRLTSEMVIKSAQMGVAIVVSRSGITQMGHEIAQRVGLCTIGRATNKHFLCYTELGGERPAAAAGRFPEFPKPAAGRPAPAGG
jgi:FdhD protein